MADKLGIQLAVEFDFKTANSNLQKLLRQLEKSNKLNLEIDTKKFQQITREYEKLKQQLSKKGVSFDAGTDKIKKDLTELQNTSSELTNRKIKLVDEEQVQRVYKLKKSLIETQTIMQNLKSGSVTKTLEFDYTAPQKLQQQIDLFKQQSEINAKKFVGKYGESADLDNLMEKIKKISMDTPQAQFEMKKLSNSFKELEVNAKNSSDKLQMNYDKTMSLSKAFSTAINKMVVWMGAATIFMQAINFIRGTITEVVTLDKSMTNLAKVTDDLNKNQFAEFISQSNEMAQSMSRTTKEVIDSVTEWKKMGYSIQEATKLAKDSMLLASVGDVTQKEANEYLLTSLKGFKKDISETESIISGMNEVANNHAVEVRDLGEAYQRFSSAMSTANNTIGQSTALFTGANTVVQNAESVSNGLKFIALRMNGVSEEGEDLSNLVPSLEKDFGKFGLTLYNQEGGLKSTYDMFKDLSSVFNEMSDMDQLNILEKIAGKRQANIASAILTDFDEVERALNSFENSSGSAQKEFQRYADSVEGHYKRLVSSFEKLQLSLLNSDTVKFFIDFAKSLVDNATALGKLNILFVATTSLLWKFVLANKAASIANKEFILTSTIGGWKKLGSDILIAVRSLLGFKTAAQGATISATAMNIAMSGLLLGLPLLAQLIGWVANSSDRADEALQKTVDSLNALNEETGQIDKLVAEKEKLDSVENKNEEQKQRLIEVEKELASLLPESTTKYDEQNQALAENIGLVKELNDAKKKELATRALQVYDKLSPDMEDDNKRLKSLIEERDKLLNARQTGEKVYAETDRGLNNGIPVTIELSNEEVSTKLGYVTDAINSINDKQRKYNDAVKMLNEVLGYNIELIGLDGKVIKSNTDDVEDNTEARNKNMQSSTDLTSVYSKVAKAMSDAKSEIQSINQALDDYTKTGKFNKDELVDLIAKYPQLLGMLDNEKALEQELIKLKGDRVNAVKSVYSVEMEALGKHISSYVNTYATGYEIDLKNFAKVSEMKSLIIAKLDAQLREANEYAAQTGRYTGYYAYNVAKQQQQIAQDFDSYINLMKFDANLGKTLGNYGTGKSSTSKQKQDELHAVEDIEGKIMEIIKKRYELELQEAEKVHKAKIEQYDKDLKAYEDYIDEKMGLIDKEADEQDYTDELKKKQQEALDIRRQIDELLLDSSREAGIKRSELEKLLAEKNEEIAKYQSDRERELRKDNLQDQLEDYKKHIEELKGLEDESFDSYKAELEAKSSEAQLHLEAKNALMNGVMLDVSGNMVTLTSAFMDFQKRFGDGLGVLANQIKKDFIDQLNEAKKVIDSMGNVTVGSDGKPLGGYSTGGVNNMPGIYELHGTTQQPEIVLNNSQASKLWNFIRNIPNMTVARTSQLAGAGANVSMHFDRLIDIHGNVDKSVMPRLEDLTNQVCDRLVRQLNLAGFYKR